MGNTRKDVGYSFYVCMNWLPNIRWKYEKTAAKPEWWTHRAELMNRYTLPSLSRAPVYVAIHEKFRKLAGPVLTVADMWGATVVWDNSKPVIDESGKHTMKVEPLEVVRRTLEGHELACVLKLDSDDMYTAAVTGQIDDHYRREAGFTLGFARGFAMCPLPFKMSTFDMPPCPPFWAKFFDGSAVESEAAYSKFRRKHHMNVGHSHLKEVPGIKFVKERSFCWIVGHGGNISSSSGKVRCDISIDKELFGGRIRW